MRKIKIQINRNETMASTLRGYIKILIFSVISAILALWLIIINKNTDTVVTASKYLTHFGEGGNSRHIGEHRKVIVNNAGINADADGVPESEYDAEVSVEITTTAADVSEIDDSHRIKAVEYALSRVGTKYKLGSNRAVVGKTTDCSKLILRAYLESGIHVGWWTGDLNSNNTKLYEIPYEEHGIGDIAVYKKSKSGIGHVVMFTGKGEQIVEASGSAGKVRTRYMNAKSKKLVANVYRVIGVNLGDILSGRKASALNDKLTADAREITEAALSKADVVNLLDGYDISESIFWIESMGGRFLHREHAPYYGVCQQSQVSYSEAGGVGRIVDHYKDDAYMRALCKDRFSYFNEKMDVIDNPILNAYTKHQLGYYTSLGLKEYLFGDDVPDDVIKVKGHTYTKQQLLGYVFNNLSPNMQTYFGEIAKASDGKYYYKLRDLNEDEERTMSYVWLVRTVVLLRNRFPG